MTHVQSEATTLRPALGATPPAHLMNEYAITKLRMLRTSNCFTFKLSSEQLRCINELKETL